MLAAIHRTPAAAKGEKAAPAKDARRATVQPAVPNVVWNQLATRVQTKLTVSTPDDPYEREADAVADRVMRTPAGPLHVQRMCSACEEEEEKIHRKADSRAAPRSGDMPLVHRALGGPSRPLSDETRAFFEPRFGADLGGVRVHTDAAAAGAAQSIHARAFTVGSHIAFAPSQYEPASHEGRRLLAHELTHVAQQSSRAPTPAVQRDPEDDPDLEEALENEILDAQADADQDDDLMLRAHASRMALLLAYHAHPPLQEQADLDDFVAECEELAINELDTLGVFSAEGRELAMAAYPKGFPLEWSGRVQAALTLGEDPATILADWQQAKKELIASSEVLAAGITDKGLPVPYEDRSRLANFQLRVADAKAEKAHPVRDYARDSIRYMQLKWVQVFAFSWEVIVNQISDAVASGEIVVNYFDWKDFVDNKQAILRDLPARARDRLAMSDEELQQLQADGVGLADAAVMVGMASALYSLVGILSGWSDATELFDKALATADQSVAAASGGERIVMAMKWAWENGYFGGAAAEWAQNLIANGPEILAETALILILGMIPGVNIAVAIYLALTIARDVLHLIVDLVSAFSAVMDATSVGALQEAAATLAAVLTNGAILILIVLVTEGIGRAAARLRKVAAELRAADKALTEEAAMEKALEKLSKEERKALEQGPAQVAKKFEEFGGVCSLGSINCRVKLPDQVANEAGAYPTAKGVPMPKGPFRVQKSALSGVTRGTEHLRDIARANRKMWPDFDKALAAAEKAGKDWVYDANGVPWEVHHVKPVFMGGDNAVNNLFPLPKAVHQQYTNWWNTVHRSFKIRFTESEWDLIYTSQKNVPGSRVPTTPKR